MVVGATRYGETSRIVKLATRDLGLQSAIAKGAMRPQSRFGGALRLLAEGTAHLIPGRGDLATLVAFDVANLHTNLAQSMESFRAGSALAELVGRFVPATPQDEPWIQLLEGLRLLESAPPEATQQVALAVLWRMIAALGVAPILDRCCRDGRSLGSDGLSLSIRDGGLLCLECARHGAVTKLPREDVEALEFFLHGEGALPRLDQPRAAAHRRLLARWVAAHLAESDLPALNLWRRG